jgi:hypothetical protein
VFIYIFRGEGLNLNEVSVGEILGRENEGKRILYESTSLCLMSPVRRPLHGRPTDRQGAAN